MMTQRQKNKIYNVSYKTLNGEKGSDDSEEETELVRNKTPRKEIPTMEKVLEEGDTPSILGNSLSLYGKRISCFCATIADLKRINNIHKENEIFAKRDD
ncbi:hypothetical protein NQ318_006230 [Aromia moschata]|uniref:LysM domain-containing protein n=1 Tax=Aromia moschata TaxID=1265417 RepID=A0AAV8XU17_9CUCU|nr:hypothetical protein NQ318_006230 [Aromia moschata]